MESSELWETLEDQINAWSGSARSDMKRGSVTGHGALADIVYFEEKAEEQAKQEAEEQAEREIEEEAAKAKQEAEEQAKREIVEEAAKAKQEAEEQAKKEAEAARIEAERQAEEEARREAEEARKEEERQAEEQARKEAEEARKKAEKVAAEQARIEAERQAEEQARKEAEEIVKQAALLGEQARLEAEEQVRKEAAERAKKAAEEQARSEAVENAEKAAQAKLESEMQGRSEAEEQARREAEEQARRKAEEQARRKAEEQARRKAEETTDTAAGLAKATSSMISRSSVAVGESAEAVVQMAAAAVAGVAAAAADAKSYIREEGLRLEQLQRIKRRMYERAQEHFDLFTRPLAKRKLHRRRIDSGASAGADGAGGEDASEAAENEEREEREEREEWAEEWVWERCEPGDDSGGLYPVKPWATRPTDLQDFGAGIALYFWLLPRLAVLMFLVGVLSAPSIGYYASPLTSTSSALAGAFSFPKDARDSWSDGYRYTHLPPLCTNTCYHANDGVCDDGGLDAAYSYCQLGTDCADCGGREDHSLDLDQYNGVEMYGAAVCTRFSKVNVSVAVAGVTGGTGGDHADVAAAAADSAYAAIGAGAAAAAAADGPAAAVAAGARAAAAAHAAGYGGKIQVEMLVPDCHPSWKQQAGFGLGIAALLISAVFWLGWRSGKMLQEWDRDTQMTADFSLVVTNPSSPQSLRAVRAALGTSSGGSGDDGEIILADLRSPEIWRSYFSNEHGQIAVDGTRPAQNEDVEAGAGADAGKLDVVAVTVALGNGPLLRTLGLQKQLELQVEQSAPGAGFEHGFQVSGL
jgi:hypothetical protein